MAIYKALSVRAHLNPSGTEALSYSKALATSVVKLSRLEGVARPHAGRTFVKCYVLYLEELPSQVKREHRAETPQCAHVVVVILEASGCCCYC